MFGFPIGNGDAGMTGVLESFTNNANSGFPNIQQREVFYSIRDGNWNDPTTWVTASGRVGKFPSSTDDVYVRNVVTFPNAIGSFSCNNLNIRGTLNCVPGTYGSLVVYGNVNCTGSGLINFPVTGGNIWYFYLLSNNNLIDKDKYIVGSSVATSYSGAIDQDVLDLNYTILHVASFSGTKYLRRDLTVDRLILDNGGGGQSSANLECGAFNLTVNGTSFIRGVALSKNNTGNLLFIGNVESRGITGPLGYRSLNLTGNPDVEFRGGIGATTNSLSIYSGTGTWRFTTNNQSFTGLNVGGGFTSPLDCPIIIANGITLTIAGTVGGISFGNYVNGEGATSRLLMGSGASLNFATQVAAENSMTTGLYDFTTNANTIYYSGNYSATIPSRFPTFHSLYVGGTGTKTFGINTTLNGNLTSNGNLDCGIYNLTVTGTSSLSNAPSGYPLTKTGAGTILFIGQLIGSASNMLNLSGGNPTVQLRGGMSVTNVQGSRFVSGSGSWSFITNNQSIITNTGGNDSLTFDCPVTIGSGVTLTLIGSNPALNRQTLIFNHPSSINGVDGTSTLISYSTLVLNAGDTLMTTGIFNPALNTISSITYAYSGGTLSLPYTNYASLTIASTGKSLGGNTTVGGTFNVGGLVNFDLSIYNLTVTGVSNINAVAGSTAYILNKTGPGTVIFIGTVNLSTGSAGRILDFSVGNPTIEFRGGMNLSNIGGTGVNQPIKFGVGTLSFSTNNQFISATGGGCDVIFDGPVDIKSDIVVTLRRTATVSNTTVNFNSSLNGNNANSSFVIGTTIGGTMNVNYNSPIQPMITGILDTSTNLNTWTYGNSNQDIKGGPTTLAKQVYRNLTLNGGGTKTLQGYVSVQNTYTLTAPASVNLNGYTLTNP